MCIGQRKYHINKQNNKEHFKIKMELYAAANHDLKINLCDTPGMNLSGRKSWVKSET